MKKLIIPFIILLVSCSSQPKPDRGIVIDKHHRPTYTTTMLINNRPVIQTHPATYRVTLVKDSLTFSECITHSTYNNIEIGDSLINGAIIIKNE